MMPRIALVLALVLAGCTASGGEERGDDGSTAATFDAIAPDETVEFTGTEPFWGGEVTRDTLRYSTPEDIEGTVIAVSRFAGNNGASWSGELDGAPFDLSVTPGRCSDGMSDRTYPFVATLSVRGETRRGCAWTEAEPFTGGEGGAADEGGEPVAEVPKLVAQDLVLAEWRKADNRARCAPLALADTASGEATARRANFAGGWGIAFDMTGQRSAFGVAGAGLMDRDRLSTRRAKLEAQWPLMRDLDALPEPSFAGYGVEGAEAYPAENPEGYGMKSVAYLRVAGQDCLYNVWSNISRAHLEALLENLRVVPTG